MPASLPIGVFDSGVGGLSVLRCISSLLPAESIMYLADSAHAPYGPKGEDFIRARSEDIMNFFMAQPVKAVVVACNTATAASVAMLRENFPLPIIGMEPAVKPAALACKSGVIGVLATEGTLASNKFVDLKSRFDGEVEILIRPCPGLVEQIEALAPDETAIRKLLRLYIEPLIAKGADTLVLGCTHYSLIAGLIADIAGEEVAIVDSGEAVARRLKSVLEENALLRLSETAGELRFYSSGDITRQEQLFSRWLGRDINVAAVA